MKKQLDLTQMGLVEMNSAEMKKVDGGGFFGALIGFVVGAVIGLAGGDVEINGQTSNSWFADAVAFAIIGAAAPI